MKIAAKFVRVAQEPKYKKVGKNETPLCIFSVIEEHKQKKGNEWEVVNTSFFPVEVWGKKANKAAIELQKGDALDLSPEINTNRNGEEYVSHCGVIEENSYTNKDGEEISQLKLKLFNWKKYDNNND